MRPLAKRITLAILGAAALALLLGIAFWPLPAAVDLARIDRGPLTVSVSEEGKTQVREVYVVSAPIAGRLLRVELRAPISGRVLRVLHESEGDVAAGTPLFELGDPQDLEILVELLSEDALRIREGAPVAVDAGAGLALDGRVRRIEPHGHTKVSALGIEEQRVNTLIDLLPPRADAGRLGHGYRVQTRTEVWRGDNLVRAPIGALFRVGDSWAVFVAAEGLARLRRISLGPRNATHATVERGLAPGESVVLHPSDRIADGVRITPRPGP
jgi:HlyD family secretion protein